MAWYTSLIVIGVVVPSSFVTIITSAVLPGLTSVTLAASPNTPPAVNKRAAIARTAAPFLPAERAEEALLVTLLAISDVTT